MQKYKSITLLFFLINGLLMAQFSKQQATDLVVNNLIAADTVNVDIFSLDSLQIIQDSIVLYGGEKISCPYNENWVYFIDDIPAANWVHSCRYLFVNAETGEDTTIEAKIYPVDWKTNYTTVNQAFHQSGNAMSTSSIAISGGLDPNPNYYAVILCGTDQQRYWYDISGIYNTLISVYGYKKDNIFVLYEDGTSVFGNDLDDPSYLSDDIDYPANYYDVDRLFRNLSGELNDPDIPELLPDSQLFLFIDGHGDGDGQGASYAMMNNFNLNDYNLAAYLENIKCSQMIIMLENCYSGGFIDDLSDYTNYNVSCKNRSIHTAANLNELSFAEFYMTWEGDPYMFFADEFVWYWNAAARGYFPVYNQPWLNTDVPIESYPFDDITEWTNHPPAYDPDVNGDGFVQMEEAFDYTNNFDTYSYYGYFDSYTGDIETPQEWYDISFQEDLLSLSGLAGHVENTQTIENRSYLVGGDLNIDPEVTLTFNDGAGLYLGNENAQVNVSSGALLNTGNNMDIFGNALNKIIVNGNIQLGQNVTFNKLGNSGYLYGLVLNNNLMQTNIEYATFNETEFRNYGMALNISNSNFNDCFIAYCFSGDVNVTNTAFDRTWLYLDNQSGNHNYTANVENCSFVSTGYNIAAIDVGHYDNFLIKNNTMNGYYNGIQVWYSGEGASGNQNINNNEIFNSMLSGIHLFNSTSSVSSNYLHNNKTGISIYDNCNIALYGNPGAQDYDEVNYITNNDSYEVYASTGSFPWYFRYNAIIDEDNLGNPTDPMVYYEPPTGGFPLMDVKYNCWGNNFDPAEDLFPSGYMVNPTWCPGGGGEKSSEVALQTFLDGEEHFKNEEYADAKTTFESVVELYSSTQYAGAAMKKLFALEKFSDNDYSALIQYYETNDSIQADTVLTKLAVFLANKCEIKLENWQTAIDHFEDIIDNPESTEDSVFAIIDLGNTYLLMGDSTGREVARGRMLQYIPESREAFAARRDYLLSLLPVTKDRKKPGNLFETSKAGVLVQNAPNPFSSTTTVVYKLTEQSAVVLKVFDHVGREVKRINEKSQNAGLNKIELNMNGLPSGIYFYSLYINGQVSDTKNMVLL